MRPATLLDMQTATARDVAALRAEIAALRTVIETALAANQPSNHLSQFGNLTA